MAFAAASLFLTLGIAVDAPPEASSQLSGALDPLSYKYPAPLQATLASFGKAVSELAGGRFAAALASLPTDSAAAATVIPDYIMLYRAKAYQDSGRLKEALDLLRTFQGLYPDSPVFTQSVLHKSLLLLTLHDPVTALSALDGPQIKDNAEVLYLRGQVLEAGEKLEAIRCYLQVYADYVGSDISDLVGGRLRALSPVFVTKSEYRETVMRRCENLIRAGRSAEARTLLLKLEGVPLPGSSTERIYLLLADADTNLARSTEALQYLRRVKDPALAAQVNYLKGVCFRGLGNETAFLESRDRALQQFAQSQFTEKLLYSVATYYDVLNREETARTAYQALANAFPKGEYAERSLWRASTFLYADGHYEDALSGFWQCLLANPTLGSVSAPAYWMGRCYERLGHPDEAAALYRHIQTLANSSYYGQRAQEALAVLKSPDSPAQGRPAAIDLAQVIQKLDSLRPVPATIPQPTPGVARTIERARQLISAGLIDLALAEFQHESAAYGSNNKALCYATARVYLSEADFLNAIIALRRAFPDYNNLPPSYLPEEIWSLFFPVRHLEFVTKNAARNHVDPNLILAVIRQESAFNESARSKANARGLMQVLPSTGRLLARQAGIPQYTAAKLHEPETNIALGTRYLAECLQRYGGRVELALAAYNAGDNRVDHWLQEFGNVDMVEFVERIPFSETRGYVKMVMSNRTHYQLRTAPASGPASSHRKE